MKKIAIIGGGFSALNLAWQLLDQDKYGKVQIEIFEKEQQLGGMASGFKEKQWEWTLEKHYHHLFAKDLAFQKFLQNLGLANKLFYRRTLTSTRWQNQTYQLDSAWSLLNFKELNLRDRWRTGIVLAFLKVIPNGQFLEKYKASDFLQKAMGKKSWKIIWQPLFQAKFAKWADDINLAWFWARIKPRTSKLGYVEGGFQALADQIQQKLGNQGVQIFLQHEVIKIQPIKQEKNNQSQFKLQIKSLKNQQSKSQEKKFDLVISTLPSTQFKKLIALPELNNTHLQGLAAMTLVLRLKDKFLLDGTYWLNINENHWPFLAVVEHDHFVDKQHYNHEHLVYLGRYLSRNDQAFRLSAKQVWQSYLPFLQKLNPLIEQLLIDYYLTKEDFAQPLVKTHHSQNLPSMCTSCPNLYWVSMQHIYPYDRGLNQAIVVSNQLAKQLAKDWY